MSNVPCFLIFFSSLLLFSDPVHVQQVEVSNLVLSMLSSLSGLWDIKMPAEFVSAEYRD